ncbi:DUF1810 family protein [Cognatishimia sp. SS12]|uniref:DUF1810 domain-containing protein n=1 Tax=Cognatishimia sp. SS12 TaxID=2979465 RepID=UPI00232CBA0A|nr:DUF1810 family protein [Cognatishimia sp. SS12]MDC0737816.1 DUF1810 family protein [Cognatishimia sp. SS12]
MPELDRFLTPQALTHEKALGEVRMGLKLSHWIWWEMPQLRGLGRSAKSVKYGLQDLEEATAYLAHPVLGPRLVALCMALLAHRNKPIEAILGPVDAQKARSMATLFAAVPGAPLVFEDVLKAFFMGMTCPQTKAALGDGPVP